MKQDKKPKEIKSLSDLTPDNANANRHTSRGMGLLEKSLRQYGAGRSVLADKNGKLIGGNATVESCAQIGMERVRVIQTDGHELVVVQRTDLDLDEDKAARELALADNRVPQLNLDFDPEQLENLAGDFAIELTALGFSEGEMAELIESNQITDADTSTSTGIKLDGNKGRPSVKIVVTVEHLATIEEALSEVGNPNRGEALAELAEEYLPQKQKDNSTLRLKAKLRKAALGVCPHPIILETHGGTGRIFTEVYEPAGCMKGVVLEKNPAKADILARQRPTWSVYEGDCEKALAGGAGRHLVFNFIDIDPYGGPFDVLESIFADNRPLADELQIVVNDGLRRKTRLGGSWNTEQLKGAVSRFGNNLFPVYLDVAKLRVSEIAKTAGYELVHWFGYYCGAGKSLSHYWGTLRRG